MKLMVVCGAVSWALAYLVMLVLAVSDPEAGADAAGWSFLFAILIGPFFALPFGVAGALLGLGYAGLVRLVRFARDAYKADDGA